MRTYEEIASPEIKRVHKHMSYEEGISLSAIKTKFLIDCSIDCSKKKAHFDADREPGGRGFAGVPIER